RIAAVGTTDRSADDVVDCTGCAILPGFINLHNHVANTLLRGVADDVPLEEMLPRAASIDAKLTRRDVQIGALLGCVEMIRSATASGCTCISPRPAGKSKATGPRRASGRSSGWRRSDSSIRA